MTALKNEIGNRYGRLTVLRREGSTASGKAIWFCKCDCGKTLVTPGDHLRSGNTVSCGCRKGEIAAMRNRNSPPRLKHGASRSGKRTAEYNAWLHMNDRCRNSRNARFEDYGGRGISVTPEWQSDFAAFFAHVGSKPSPEHSLDRFPDNDGNYEPGNVRWATSSEQNSNRRKGR